MNTTCNQSLPANCCDPIQQSSAVAQSLLTPAPPVRQWRLGLRIFATSAIAIFIAWSASAATLHVWQDSPNPAPPYATWDAAAHSIQEAVDAAQADDTVLVTNGVYATGSREVIAIGINRVVVDKAVTLQSVNGPEVTAIQGAPASRGGNGDGAIRCVYLGTNAVLSGFTLTNGFTQDYPASSQEQYGGGAWSESSATLTNCILTGNSASILGGGAHGGKLYDCTVTDNNSASTGGGASSCTVYNCRVSDNSAEHAGGGAYQSTLINSTVSDNSANVGGGASRSTLVNCTVSDNSANGGGGAYQSTLINCTVTGNLASSSGGGVHEGVVYNCIVYFNSALTGPNYYGNGADSISLNYSCTTPLPANGVGNISQDPRLASGSHLSSDSPCIGAGSADYASGTDIDGDPWASPPSMGCDEYVAGNATGPLRVALSASHTNVAPGFLLNFSARIDGYSAINLWEFGDGATATNRLHTTHAWAMSGIYPVVVRAYNESWPQGVTATVWVRVADSTTYVDVAGTNPTPPYDSWATAATNLQDALAAVSPGNEIWVAQGTYYPDEGGTATPDDRDATFNLIDGVALYGGFPTGGGDGTFAARDYTAYTTILSGDLLQDDGPDFTNRADNARHVLTANSVTPAAILDGFTITAGYDVSAGWGIPPGLGVGLLCQSASPSLANCSFLGNFADWGGAIYNRDSSPSLDNCSFLGNTARNSGGAVFNRNSSPLLTNCSFLDNSGSDGGAVFNYNSSPSLTNCSFEGNSAHEGGAMFNVGSSPTLTDCIFNDNSARDRGGAIYNSDSEVGWGDGYSSPTLVNCSFQGNSAASAGGAIHNAGSSSLTLAHCTFQGNSATNDFCRGGGLQLPGPTPSYGGAIYSERDSSTSLTYCSFSENTAGCGGGAIHLGSSSLTALSHCSFSGNSARHGGAVYSSSASPTFTNCSFVGNSAYASNIGPSTGGAVFMAWAASPVFVNCRFEGNSANYGGGVGTDGGTGNSFALYNCTLTGNTASGVGGGAYGGTFYNCILYFNSSPLGANYYGDGNNPISLNYTCTTPLPTNGVGNISLDPRLASASHLSADSPCIGAGSPDYATGTDIDGTPWASPPSMGCDEYVAGAATGPLSVAVTASYTNVATGFRVEFAPSIDGNVTAHSWDFGDGVAVSNQFYGVSHTWSLPGSYPVVLRAYNDTWAEGVSATVWMHVLEDPVQYVDAAGHNPTPPFLSWATAATNIQDAADVAFANGTVLVTNGIYATGGRAVVGTMTNRVAIDKPITVQSVNGPEATVIQGATAPGAGNGDGAIRCVYLGPNATLSGFTLTNGHTRAYPNPDGDNPTREERLGGGAWLAASATLANSIIIGNSADHGGGGIYGGTLRNCVLSGNSVNSPYPLSLYPHGGGAYESILYNCILTGNSSSYSGGGAYQSTLYNCTVIGNAANYCGGGAYSGKLYNCTITDNTAGSHGGGAYVGTLNNCIVYFNSATDGANFYGGNLSYSCTTPLPSNGVGNITNAPVFVNTNDWSDLRLRYGSPGIDAGTNLSAVLTTDLDGNPRPLDGDGDGLAAFDMGAYEFDARSIIPPDWFTRHGLDANDPHVVSGNPDHDAFTTFQEWLADTDPTNALSFFHLEAISKESPAGVSFQSSSNRTYTLWSTPQLVSPDWVVVPGQETVPGNGGTLTLSDPTNALRQFYRVEVSLP